MKKELELYVLALFFKNREETELNKRIEYYREFLLQKGSQVMIKNFGKVSLAYPIKDIETAVSVQIVYLGNGNLVNQLNTELQRDLSVLRATTTTLTDQKTAELFSLN